MEYLIVRAETTIEPGPDSSPVPEDGETSRNFVGNVLAMALYTFGVSFGVWMVYTLIDRSWLHRRQTSAASRLGRSAEQGARSEDGDGGNEPLRADVRVLQQGNDIVFEFPPNAETGASAEMRTIFSTSKASVLQAFDAKEEHKDMMCALCLEPLSETRLAALPCGHALHEECFKSWVVKTGRLDCPICAQDFTRYDPVEASRGGTSEQRVLT